MLFCFCVCAVPCEEEASIPLPQGLVLVEDFVTPEEEAQLLAAVDWSSADDEETGSIFRLFVLRYHILLLVTCLKFQLR